MELCGRCDTELQSTPEHLADKKAEQLELVTAMLQAAEEELKLRSNQLELTNAMLSALEGEVARKDEQLEITTQMLRKAEEELSGVRASRNLRLELQRLAWG